MLLVLDRPVLVELIKMTLNHGVYTTRQVTAPAEVEAALSEWRPHLALVDMDLDGARVMALLASTLVGGIRVPVIGLTRRGDLKTKLAAFEAGVDDILTVPFAPEELLARVIALVRRAYSDAVTFTPVIKIGELEIENYRTVLLDLSHVNASYEQVGLKPVDGVLGSDILKMYKAVIDYEKKIVKLKFLKRNKVIK